MPKGAQDLELDVLALELLARHTILLLKVLHWDTFFLSSFLYHIVNNLEKGLINFLIPFGYKINLKPIW